VVPPFSFIITSFRSGYQDRHWRATRYELFMITSLYYDYKTQSFLRVDSKLSLTSIIASYISFSFLSNCIRSNDLEYISFHSFEIVLQRCPPSLPCLWIREGTAGESTEIMVASTWTRTAQRRCSEGNQSATTFATCSRDLAFLPKRELDGEGAVKSWYEPKIPFVCVSRDVATYGKHLLTSTKSSRQC